jgi:predicted DNA-binding protein
MEVLMSTQMVIRLESELKDKVDRLARKEGKATSTVVRGLIEDYVRDHDIEGYIDNLWERIGKKVDSQGITSRDIQKAIKSTRKSR